MSNFIVITHDTLQVEQVSKQVTDTCTGATSLFVGTTRDNFQGKKVVKLEYEAYVPMAKKKLNELCNRYFTFDYCMTSLFLSIPKDCSMTGFFR